MPRPKPTATGINAANRPGVASSRRESLVQMSTTLPYSGLAVPSMIPGISRNWRRTSKTMAPAARVTALMARPEKRNTAQPRSRPTRVLGVTIWRSNIDWTYLLGSSVSSLPSMIRRSSLCQASL